MRVNEVNEDEGCGVCAGGYECRQMALARIPDGSVFFLSI